MRYLVRLALCCAFAWLVLPLGVGADAVNHAPVPVRDFASTYPLPDYALTFMPASNDGDPDGDSVTMVAFDDPVHGTASVDGDGFLSYQADTSFIGVDAFWYVVEDGQGGSAKEWIVISIIGDVDGDEAFNDFDNCPVTYNPGQEEDEFDEDYVGDACDAPPYNFDYDGDGWGDVGDWCPTIPDAENLDSDFDWFGDLCDATPLREGDELDADGDGVANGVDNCPTIANPDQARSGLGIYGDACEIRLPDVDGDGVWDDDDNCVLVANPDQAQDDSSRGEFGNVCSVPLLPLIDSDGDVLTGDVDNCPIVANGDQADANGDGIGDACDEAPVDATAPVVTVPADLTAEATGPDGASIAFDPAPTAHDDVDGDVPVSCSSESGATIGVGEQVDVTCSATDAAGNTGTASFALAVVDTAAPEVLVPASVAVEATGPTTVVAFEASAMDVVSGSVATACSPASGSGFTVGTTEVVCTASDAAGNEGTASFAVEVTDTTAPSLAGGPAAILAAASSTAGATVAYEEPTANDAVDGPTIVDCSTPSGGQFPVGTTTVTCTAVDVAGNAASVAFPVTVSIDAAECKHGGWRAFDAPAFGDQGSCVGSMREAAQR